MNWYELVPPLPPAPQTALRATHEGRGRPGLSLSPFTIPRRCCAARGCAHPSVASPLRLQGGLSGRSVDWPIVSPLLVHS